MATLNDSRKRELRRELAAIVGPTAVLSDPDELMVYESDGLTLFRALADFVVFPTSAQHVSAIVKLANRENLPFVARGAGTGLSGGCLPTEGGIVISMMRMNRVLEVDYENQFAVVEPGLDDGELVLVVDLEDPVHPHHRDHDAALGGQASAREPGARAAGDERKVLAVRELHDCRHVLGRCLEDDE